MKNQSEVLVSTPLSDSVEEISNSDSEVECSDDSSDSSESLKYTMDSKIDDFLSSLKLDKYIPVINAEEFTFETFVNLSSEDMDILGIDPEDKEILLSNCSTLTHRFEKYDIQNDIQFDTILKNTNEQLEKVCGKLILTVNNLKVEKHPENIFLDDITSSAQALQLLADKALDCTSYLENDVKKLKNYSQKSWKNILFNEYTAFGLVSVITYAFIKKRRLY